jgi:hypothetical protein
MFKLYKKQIISKYEGSLKKKLDEEQEGKKEEETDFL